MSIRNRLLFWLLSGLTILGACFVLADYLIDRALLADIYNDQMSQIAFAIPADFSGGDLERNPPALKYDGDDSILQIWDQNGKLSYRSHAGISLPQFTTPGFSEVRWRDSEWTLFIRKTDHNLIQVAQSLSGRRNIALDHALRTLIPLLMFLLIMGLLIHWSVGTGLQSLTRLSQELAKRTPDTLGRLTAQDQPAEIKPLTHALDTLLQRLSVALEGQKKFIADASHELRTPLATLQIQTQLVEQSLGSGREIHALADLKAGVKRSSHLVEQLLMVSRLESAGIHDPHTRLQLHEIAREVIIDLIPFANTREINLGVEQLDAGVIMGSEHHLHILLRNLIDNAVRYTPSGGQVDVTIHARQDDILLEIEDSGPGIPAAEQERVFDRFYRCLVPQATGSGLGLAIVKQVAELHQAEVQLGQAQRLSGLRASVIFKRAV
ncbi:ATP-binding protein [Collimonas sp.]|uniref:ATP-binding protein n=1 Tax=Collimonas sp. TaxID=1963772 RepID=UPI002BC00DC9|nr:ATP-binding protein [Collimonas sp.]HWW07497.1 ATP-binding protein [Collimonas sp.]